MDFHPGFPNRLEGHMQDTGLANIIDLAVERLKRRPPAPAGPPLAA
jgi:hypothetical protein